MSLFPLSKSPLAAAFRRRRVRSSRPRRFRWSRSLPVAAELLEKRLLLSSGALDTAFGTGGVVVTDLGGSDGARGVAIQEDGKIVVAGVAGSFDNEGRLVRYNEDGTLDASFGTGGVVDVGFGRVQDVAVDSQGKIVVVGSVLNGADRPLAIARFDSGGAPDASFGGGDGLVTQDFGTFDERAGAVAIAANDEIIVAATADNAFVVARYDSSGNPLWDLREDFGLGAIDTEPEDVAIDAAGHIVVVGSLQILRPSGNTHNIPAIMRVDANGNLDPAFSIDGRLALDFQDFPFNLLGFFSGTATAVAFDADGNILVGGTVDNDFAVARLTADGALDPTFSTDGYAKTDFGTLIGPLRPDGQGNMVRCDTADVASGLIVQDDGTIILTGLVGFRPEIHPPFLELFGPCAAEPDLEKAHVALAAYTPAGELEQGFGVSGLVTTTFPDLDFAGGSPAASARYDDSRIVVVGQVSPGANFGTVRYLYAPPSADLAIAGISDAPDPLNIGQHLTYSIDVSNKGPSNATGVALRLALPTHTILLSANYPVSFFPATSEVEFDLGNLANGSQATANIIVRAGAPGPLIATARVEASEVDPDVSNNEATETTTVVAPDYVVRVVEEAPAGVFFGPPALNNNAEVAYERARLFPSSFSQIVAGDPSSLTVIADTLSFPPPPEGERLSFGSPDINDDGTVAFEVRVTGPESQTGVFAGTGGALTTIRQIGPPGRIAFPGINNSGAVVFGESTEPDGAHRIRLYSAGEIATVVEDNDPLLSEFGPLVQVFDHHINDGGTVVFNASPGTGGVAVLTRTANGPVTTLFSDPAGATVVSPSININNSGTVVFLLDRLPENPSAGEVLAATDGGPPITIADTLDAYQFIGTPSLNNDGLVYFEASLDDGGHGIFTGPDPARDRVIATGDSLFGSTVTDVSLQRSAANDRGQVAFGVSLADRRELIVVASSDNDHDGIPDFEEDAAPNGGDGDNSGTRDSLEQHVVSLPNAIDGGYVTLSAPDGTRLVNVRAVDPGSISDPRPPGAAFPIGLFEFTIEGVDPGGQVIVQLIDHSGSSPNSYFKYGPTPGDPSPHWYDFAFDGLTGASPSLLSGATNLFFVNGQRGDSDLNSANNRIVDPGGPAIVTLASLDASGPDAGVRGQPLAFTFTAEPPGDYAYEVDWDGDGTIDESLAGSESLTAQHVYPEAGTFTLHVTATSTASGAAAEASHDVTIDVVAVIDGNLVVGGTPLHDRILFHRTSDDTVLVWLNGERFGPFGLSGDARLIAFGQAGNDRIAAGNIRRDVEFFGGPGHDVLVGGPGDDLLDGGPGNDLLFGHDGNDLLDGGPGHDLVLGGSGHDILLGGEGNDLLFGMSGRDLLIGGLGRDGLFGGSQEDILIGGMTLFDANQAALFAIRDEWTSSRSRAERIANLTDGSGPDGANDGFFLRRNETVQDDGEPDLLAGGLALDWVFAEDLDLILFGRDDDDDD